MVLSAGMGKGHNSAAVGLSRLLTSASYEAQVIDLLETMRFGYGQFINALYHAQLRYAPGSYQAVYSAWRDHPSLVRSANGIDTLAVRKHLLERVASMRPDAIISTYNLGSQVLGELSVAGALDVPVYSYVTDFGVHPYWIHNGINGYLTVHESSARTIRALTSAPVAVCGPLVDPSFVALSFPEVPPSEGQDPEGYRATTVPQASGPRREATRRALGVGGRDSVVLVVAGAWGAGDVEATISDLGAIPGWAPVVVCGTNRKLRVRLMREPLDERRVIGFTTQMPRLMEAADVLVENAGGMTSFEAFAAHLPVITYRPIPGHGIDNAHAMATAGVTTFAQNQRQLAAALNSLRPGGPERARQIQRGAEVLSTDPDPTSVVLDLIDRGRQTASGHCLTGSR